MGSGVVVPEREMVSSLGGVRIAGIASAVPGPSRSVEEDSSIPPGELKKISAVTGVTRRHLVARGVCASDLCLAAARRLLNEAALPPESVDALIFVTQTPDYLLPATACVLHGRLGLSPSCAAFDVNLGCSGYVYGLWLASSLVLSGARRVLLLAGDTISRVVSPDDRSVSVLFGDAGTATLLESSPDAPPIHFELGTDGAGFENLIVPAGGFRKPISPETGLRSEREGSNVRCDQDLYMNGSEIFAFTMKVVPGLCQAVLQQAGWSMEALDAVVMHQANRFMLQHLGRLRVAEQKVMLSLQNYGNTSSASIPLAITDRLRDHLSKQSAKLLLAGFGVGFSWAAAAVECGPLVIPALVQLDPPASAAA
jgi:3-oxoacyl-[acyl-carrier-protein] synthase-3